MFVFAYLHSPATRIVNKASGTVLLGGTVLQIGGTVLDTSKPVLQINSTVLTASSRIVRDMIQFGMPVLQVVPSSSRTLQLDLSTSVVAGESGSTTYM